MTGYQPDTDVIIVGGGLTGCTLATILARQGIRCLIIEEQEKVSDDSSTYIDPRALAITCASENILRAAGAWANLAEDKIGYFREMFVWETMGEGEITFTELIHTLEKNGNLRDVKGIGFRENGKAVINAVVK